MKTYLDYNKYAQDQADYYKENKDDFMEWIGTDKEPTDEYIEQYEYDFEFHYEDFQEDMRELFSSWVGKKAKVVYSDVGWTNRSGEAEVTLTDDHMFLYNLIRPNADHNFHVTRDGNTAEIKLYHHDSPFGETYKVTLL